MRFFSRRRKNEKALDFNPSRPINSSLRPDEIFAVRLKKPSYIEIVRILENQNSIRIRGGNHKIRLIGTGWYSNRNVMRAAKRLADDTGLEVIDRRAKK